jgi:hypothetical protein
MKNKVLQLIKKHTSNLQRNNQTELSLANEQSILANEIVKLLDLHAVIKSVCTCKNPQVALMDTNGYMECRCGKQIVQTVL